MAEQHAHEAEGTRTNHYRRFLLMIVLSFVAMYILMYAMVDVFGNALSNLNQVYMAGLMTAAMVIIELTVMRGMYHDKRRNAIILTAGVVAMALFWTFTRRQVGIGDDQFLRSMIPHHAGAILMCNEASIRSPGIRQLCTGIIASQQSEITQMKELLDSP
jgi:uncharacterized protein (DUF305 family)